MDSNAYHGYTQSDFEYVKANYKTKTTKEMAKVDQALDLLSGVVWVSTITNKDKFSIIGKEGAWKLAYHSLEVDASGGAAYKCEDENGNRVDLHWNAQVKLITENNSNAKR